MPPKEAPNARFRLQVDMGSFDGGSPELKRAIDELRHNHQFGPTNYNLIRKNCNHFANALCWQLLRRTIPAYVNRCADIGSCCSCLLPKQLLEGAPVGGSSSTSGSSSSSLAVPTNTRMQRPSNTSPNIFAGKGYSLGGSTSNQESEGLLSRWTTTAQAQQQQEDSLTDRREKARKAALARLELNSLPPDKQS